MFRLLILLATAIALILYLNQNQPELSVPATPVALAKLLSTPDAFDGKTVRVSGRITSRASLLGAGGLFLSDGAGNELMVLGLGTMPRPGTLAQITGHFRLLYSFARFEGPVLLVGQPE